jgi:FixJ family two-component response regulator
MKKRIAQVSADADLAHSRAELLHTAGYEVKTFHSSDELLQDPIRQKFDLLIVGHSLEYPTREKVHVLFKQFNPDSPVLQLTSSNESVPGADLSFNVFQGPEEFLHTVAKVLQFSKS